MSSKLFPSFAATRLSLGVIVSLAALLALARAQADAAPARASGDYILVGGELQARASGEITDDISEAALTPGASVTAALAASGAGGPPAAAESENAIPLSIGSPRALALAPDGGLYVGAGSVIWRVRPDNTAYPLIGVASLLVGGTDTIPGSSGGSITVSSYYISGSELEFRSAGTLTLTGATLTLVTGTYLTGINGGDLVLSSGTNSTVWSGSSYYGGGVSLFTITGTDWLRPLGAPSAGEDNTEAGDTGTGVSGTLTYTDFGPFQNISALVCRSGTLYAADSGQNLIYAIHASTAAIGAADPAGFNGAPVWSRIA
ncbi:MAG: hypothetical protein LBM92_03685, partial [Opitutaceae bacterium]|nr:hypothetical protein [Opitutaceae bacterium]